MCVTNNFISNFVGENVPLHEGVKTKLMNAKYMHEIRYTSATNEYLKLGGMFHMK